MKTTGILGRLHEEHEQIATLLEAAETTEAAEDRRGLFETLRKELIVHFRAEEAVFYELLRQHEESEEQAEESIEDHDEIEDLLDELDSRDVEDDEWLDLFQELRGMVEDHVVEEEDELFQLAWEVIGEEKLVDVEDQYGAERDRAEAQLIELEPEPEVRPGPSHA